MCYAPVCHSFLTEVKESFDLHALDTPPAFILSQDQTLKYNSIFSKLDMALSNKRCNHTMDNCVIWKNIKLYKDLVQIVEIKTHPHL